MDRIKYEYESFLGKNDFQSGKVYVIKDGRVMLYIGKDIFNRNVFYLIGSLLLRVENYDEVGIAHQDLQLAALHSLFEQLMREKCDAKYLQCMKGLPKAYSELPLECEVKDVRGWYQSSGKDLPELAAVGENPADNIYVKGSDLIPGELYYTGSLWRALYLYLGQDSSKRYCWYFVDNEDILRQCDVRQFVAEAERTKSPKKVKKLSYALQDPGAYISADVQKLIDENWTADLSDLDLNAHRPLWAGYGQASRSSIF